MRLTATMLLISTATAACSDAPVLLASQAVASPDSNWVAVVEELDNGLGFGLGALYSEVHVVRANSPPSSHGNSSNSVVFYTNVSDYRSSQPAVSVQWLTPTHLRVAYAKSLVPGKRLAALAAITVEYSAKVEQP